MENNRDSLTKKTAKNDNEIYHWFKDKYEGNTKEEVFFDVKFSGTDVCSFIKRYLQDHDVDGLDFRIRKLEIDIIRTENNIEEDRVYLERIKADKIKKINTECDILDGMLKLDKLRLELQLEENKIKE